MTRLKIAGRLMPESLRPPVANDVLGSFYQKTKLTSRQHASKHGFSKCEICKARLYFWLNSGRRTFEETMAMMRERHPDITNIRKYTQRAIRESTGLGIFDNWIVDHNFWKVRRPVIATGEALELLHEYQKELYAKGEMLTRFIRKAESGNKDVLLGLRVGMARR